MSEWKQKRFWTDVTVTEVDGGWTVLLDGRGVKTPAKAPLVMPGQAMAQEVAQEWEAQDGIVDPTGMPFTRSVNAAIDKVRTQHAEVAELLSAYGDSDLLCYRAEGPEGLIARQAESWDPLLDWAADAFGARLQVRTGIMHAPQDKAALQALSARVHALSAFQLAGFHDLVGLSGSLILGLAVAEGGYSAEHIWDLSRLDEIWQAEQWGDDEEAMELSEIRKSAFLHAERFFQLSVA